MPAVMCRHCRVLVEYVPKERASRIRCTMCGGNNPIPGRRKRFQAFRSTTTGEFLKNVFSAGTARVRNLLLFLVGSLVLASPFVLSMYITRNPELAETSARGMHENWDFFRWLDEDHEFAAPDETRFERVRNGEWNDPKYQHLSDHSDTPLRKNGVYKITVEVDRAFSEAVETHYYLPEATFWSITPLQSDRLQRRKTEAFAQHGWLLREGKLAPDYDWMIDRVVDQIRPVAEAVVIEMEGGLDVSPRRKVHALTSYVQGAVPYQRVEQSRDGRERGELRSPMEVLFLGGDCDSQSLLLLALVRSLEPAIPLAMIVVQAEERDEEIQNKSGKLVPHAVAGVGLAPMAGEIQCKAESSDFVMIETAYDRVHPNREDRTPLAGPSDLSDYLERRIEVRELRSMPGLTDDH